MKKLKDILNEIKMDEALPKFKSPLEAYKWIMNKRGEAMDIEQEMMDTNADIQQLYGDMEQAVTQPNINPEAGSDMESADDLAEI